MSDTEKIDVRLCLGIKDIFKLKDKSLFIISRVGVYKDFSVVQFF